MQPEVVVAKARIQINDATTLIPSLLARIAEALETTNERGARRDGQSATQAHLAALIWLGAQDDPDVMRHTAQPSLNHARPADLFRQLDPGAGNPSPWISTPLRAVLLGRDSATAFDDR